MMRAKDIIRWLRTLPEGSQVGIDEGGLTLVVEGDPGPYLEVGGLPNDEEEG